MAKQTDPTEPIRAMASQYAGVDRGMACTQAAFKVGKNSFLYIGEQGGRYKAMFKLSDSKSEAQVLAKQQPENYQVGNTAWVTARFSADQPMPSKIWKKWLDESYQLSITGTKGRSKSASKKTTRGKQPRKSK